MDPVTGLAIATGAAGLLGAFGTFQTNSANKEIAVRQMRFQRQMSNTAHQREMRDLSRSGLNPILAANTGASTPGGASATMQNPLADVGDSFIDALSIRNMAKQNQLLDAQTAKQVEETQTIKALRPLRVAQSKADVVTSEKTNKGLQTRQWIDAIGSIIGAGSSVGRVIMSARQAAAAEKAAERPINYYY